MQSRTLYVKDLFKDSEHFKTLQILVGLHCIIDKKCKCFYENLLYKTFKAPLHRSLFSKFFSVQKDSWENIYINKIKNIYETRLNKFNYKLLNNTRCCNSIASFLNVNIDPHINVICVMI